MSIDSGSDAFNIPARGQHTVWLWLRGNHVRLVATDVQYDDGYHYRQTREYTFASAQPEKIAIDDAPPPTITFENLSMGSARFFHNGVPIAEGTYPAPVNGQTRSLEARTYYGDGSQPYETFGTFNPEYGFVYRFLACGETGTQGQNCGLFYDRVNDGGWDDQ